jgi:hypothetical protein
MVRKTHPTELPDQVYEDIGRALRAIARGYVEAYRLAKGGKGKDAK